jgi:hypothetical protein
LGVVGEASSYVGESLSDTLVISDGNRQVTVFSDLLL